MDFVKIVVFLQCVCVYRKIIIFKGRSFEKSIKNREKIDAKIDAKNDAQKKRAKLASGSNFGALGRVRAGPGRPKSAPRALQDDPKSGDTWVAALCDALGRSWAHFFDFW